MNWELLGVFLLLVLVVIPVLAGAFVLLLRTFRTEGRRRRRAREYARRAGWVFTPSQPELAGEYFGIPPFTSGTRRRFDDVIHHTDGRYQGHSFDFSFGIGPKSREYRHYQHVVTLLLPATLPPMSLRPQYATDSLGIALGLQDIHLESEEFNRTWLVRGASRAAVHDVLHPRAMNWFMEPRNRNLTFGISGRYLFVCIPGRQHVERIPDVANRLVEFADLIPSFVWDKAHGRG
ncbi:MAG TPA: hypothetical protein VK098_00665 [Beutenbergiaceae bacterium]|nr:hypothetical protein [Beutenbergiaceae bacterium]